MERFKYSQTSIQRLHHLVVYLQEVSLSFPIKDNNKLCVHWFRGRIIDTNHGYDQVAYDKATSFGENSILITEYQIPLEQETADYIYNKNEIY